MDLRRSCARQLSIFRCGYGGILIVTKITTVRKATPRCFSDSNRGNTTEPDSEDINRDQSMNTIDSYFEYRVPFKIYGSW